MFEQPGGLPLGTVELRLFANNDFTRLATSTIFVLTGADKLLRKHATE